MNFPDKNTLQSLHLQLIRCVDHNNLDTNSQKTKFLYGEGEEIQKIYPKKSREFIKIKKIKTIK